MGCSSKRVRWEIGHKGLEPSDRHERFARQMTLLEQIEATAGDLEKVSTRWHRQLAALAELSGRAASTADVSGLPKADIEAATKSVDKAEVDAAVAAATATGVAASA